MDIVNGYICRDCTDVANAKRHVDPAHPKDGPYGVNAPPERGGLDSQPAFKLGGQLAAAGGVTPTSTASQTPGSTQALRVDLTV